jgi:hypothetical protein
MDLPAILLSAAVALGAFGALMLAWAIRGRSTRGRPRCRTCWYDLSMIESASCPECGVKLPAMRNLLRPRRRNRWMAVGLVLMASCPALLWVRHAQMVGWNKATPLQVLWVMVTWGKSEWALSTLQWRLSVRSNESATGQPWANGFAAWQWNQLSSTLSEIACDSGEGLPMRETAVQFMISAGIRTDHFARASTAIFQEQQQGLVEHALWLLLQTGGETARSTLASDECFRAMTRLVELNSYRATSAAMIIGEYGFGHPQREAWVIRRLHSSTCDEWFITQDLLQEDRLRMRLEPELSNVAVDAQASACERLYALVAVGDVIPWSQDIEDVLIEAIVSNDPMQRMRATEALRKFGLSAAGAIDRLVALLENPNGAVRQQVATALGAVGRGEPERVAAVLKRRAAGDEEYMLSWYELALEELGQPLDAAKGLRSIPLE